MRKSTFVNMSATLLFMMLLGSVISFVFVSSLGALMEQYFWVKIACQVVILLSYLMLLFSPLRNYGEQDVNRVRIGVKKENQLTGLLFGLVLMIPYVLAFLFLSLGKLRLIFDMLPAYRLINSQFFVLISTCVGGAMTLQELSWGMLVVITLVIPLIIPVMTTLFYYLGYKQISFVNKIMYQNTKNSKN